MLPIGECTLSPVPPLRAGVLTPEQVHEWIARGFVNWNPATGSFPGLPGRMGWQSWKVRMQGAKVIQKSSQRIFESLDEHGQINPVLLWARWGSLFVAYGGTRVLWSFQGRHPLKALIVDHDHRFDDWRLVPYESILKEYTVPPHGVVPMQFGWAYGEDYVIADAREWQMMSESDWEKHLASLQPEPRRKRGRPKKIAV